MRSLFKLSRGRRDKRLRMQRMLAGIAGISLLSAGMSSVASATDNGLVPPDLAKQTEQSGGELIEDQMSGASTNDDLKSQPDPDQPTAPAAFSMFGAPRDGDAPLKLSCEAGSLYAIASNARGVGGGAQGQLVHVAPDGTSEKVGQQLPSAYDSEHTGTSSAYSWNGLGVSADGTWAMAFQRTNARDVRMWRYDALADEWENTGDFFQMAQSGDEALGYAIAGAVCPECGTFLWGGYDTAVSANSETGATASKKFQVWAYDYDAGTNTYLGYIPVEPDKFDAGDIASDAKGNLYLAAGNSKKPWMRLYSVTHENMMAAEGGAMIASESPMREFQTDVNGIALDSLGSVYASSGKTVHKADLPLVTDIREVTSNMFTEFTGTWSSNDLASCTTHVPTITVQKNVVGRADSEDQFTLNLAVKDGDTWEDVAEPVTTAGEETGLQAEVSGPWATARGLEFRFGESAPEGQEDLTDFYETSWQCESDTGWSTKGIGVTG